MLSAKSLVSHHEKNETFNENMFYVLSVFILQVNITELRKMMKSHDEKKNTIEKNMRDIEDRVFAEFCSKIGVPNIRAYEGVNLRFVSYIIGL